MDPHKMRETSLQFIYPAMSIRSLATNVRLSEQAARRRPACLRRLTGTVVSRRGLDAKAPPEATREFPNAR
jgi:hypothetical protein